MPKQTIKKKTKPKKKVVVVWKKPRFDDKPEGYVFGRPADYKPEYCDLLRFHMAQGKAFREFCAVVGVSFQTLYAWTKSYPDFLDAKEHGEDLSYAWWMKQARKGLYHPNFKVANWRINMMNRFDWSERSKVEHAGGVDFNKKYADMTDEELDAALNKLKSKLNDEPSRES